MKAYMLGMSMKKVKYDGFSFVNVFVETIRVVVQVKK